VSSVVSVTYTGPPFRTSKYATEYNKGNENIKRKVGSICRDVIVLGLGPWFLVVLKDKTGVHGPGLGLER